MDPLSQAVLGAAAAASAAPPQQARIACLLGLLAGMAPDLDVFIRSASDPLLFLEYHRQFTHSLIFVPFGGLICGLVLYHLFARKQGLTLGRSILYCTLGYATHALLDACTTYGTQLFWPFSDVRIAWNTVSVIDPLFTLPILILIVYAGRQRSAVLARLALAWAIAYPTIGLLQRDRAEALGWEIARSRDHQPVSLEAKPSFANLVLWKIVYETSDDYYVDAVRVGFSSKVFDGERIPKLDLERDFPWLDHDSQQAQDIERFRWFSGGYVARDPHHANRITDIRFSMLPNQILGLWSIQLSEQAGVDSHVSYEVSRDTSDAVLEKFRAMLFE